MAPVVDLRDSCFESIQKEKYEYLAQYDAPYNQQYNLYRELVKIGEGIQLLRVQRPCGFKQKVRQLYGIRENFALSLEYCQVSLFFLFFHFHLQTLQ